MKKLLIIVVSFLFYNNIFAYEKTEKDSITINNIINKIENSYIDKNSIIEDLNALKLKYSNNERTLWMLNEIIIRLWNKDHKLCFYWGNCLDDWKQLYYSGSEIIQKSKSEFKNSEWDYNEYDWKILNPWISYTYNDNYGSIEITLNNWYYISNTYWAWFKSQTLLNKTIKDFPLPENIKVSDDIYINNISPNIDNLSYNETAKLNIKDFKKNLWKVFLEKWIIPLNLEFNEYPWIFFSYKLEFSKNLLNKSAWEAEQWYAIVDISKYNMEVSKIPNDLNTTKSILKELKPKLLRGDKWVFCYDDEENTNWVNVVDIDKLTTNDLPIIQLNDLSKNYKILSLKYPYCIPHYDR